MARNGIDIAVRTGALASETLVARRIGGFGRTVVASPAYLKRFGTPRKVAELDEHRLIGYTANPEMNRWPLRNSGNQAAYQVRPYTSSDNVALVLTLAREGVGVGRLMDLLAPPLVRRDELVPLLQDEIDNEHRCCRSDTATIGHNRSASGRPHRRLSRKLRRMERGARWRTSGADAKKPIGPILASFAVLSKTLDIAAWRATQNKIANSYTIEITV